MRAVDDEDDFTAPAVSSCMVSFLCGCPFGSRRARLLKIGRRWDV